MYSTTFGAWSIWGEGYAQIATNIITRPIDVLVYFFTVLPLEKLLYFFWFLAPLLFLPLLAPKEFVLLAMPWIALVFLSAYPGYFTNQYAAFVAPQVFIAAIYGLRQVSKSPVDNSARKSLIMRYGIWILWGAMIAFILIGPFGIVPQSRGIYVHGLPQKTSHKQALQNALQIIPENASVYTSFHIAPHLSNRQELYSNAIPDKPPDFIVIDLKSLDSSISLGVLGDAPVKGMDELMQISNYSLTLSDDGILIYAKTTSHSPSSESISMHFDYQDLSLDFGDVVLDTSSESSRVFSHETTDWPYGFWHGPYVALPRGSYEVTYRVKTDTVIEGHMMTLDVTSDSGVTQLARKYVYGHDMAPNLWNEITLQFSIDKPQTYVEFRGTYASNSSKQYLDFIDIAQLSSIAKATFGTSSYNYQDLTTIKDNATADDLVVHQRNDSTPFSFGLSAKIPQGTYKAKFWFKSDEPSQGKILSISIDDFNTTNLARIDIYIDDFQSVGSWQAFSTDFMMSNSTSVVEIRGTSSTQTSISFSYAELESNG
jgi:hypothetical protein